MSVHELCDNSQANYGQPSDVALLDLTIAAIGIQLAHAAVPAVDFVGQHP
ncbi:MAG TPA: hypothetical protein VF006_32535 [Longimicrobium sp.]